MKKIIFMAIVTVVIFTHCSKTVDNKVDSTPAPLPPLKHLTANAGSDTTICMPYGGTGNIFKTILNGRASSDDAGNILSYSWSAVKKEGSPDLQSQITDVSKDSTTVRFLSGDATYQFNLEVRDDQGRVDNDQVTINVISRFNYQYDGLSWDSITAGLQTISVKFKPGLMESWPRGSFEDIYLINSNAGCRDIISWQKLPFVLYDSIQQTDKPIFYTLVTGHPNIFSQGNLYTEIYARSNAGIDLTQKVSIGFTMFRPLDY